MVVRKIRGTNIRKIYEDNEVIGIIANKQELLDNDLLLPEFPRDNLGNWIIVVDKKIIKEFKSFEECKAFVVNNPEKILNSNNNLTQKLLANEVKASFLEDEDALKDRKLFVHNLGVLLSQTREGIISAELDDNEIVTVSFKRGAQKSVNVNMDSYTAIIKDVVSSIL